MTEERLERDIEETAQALAVEGLVMSREERDNLRKVGRGELTYSELVALHMNRARAFAATDDA